MQYVMWLLIQFDSHDCAGDLRACFACGTMHSAIHFGASLFGSDFESSSSFVSLFQPVFATTLSTNRLQYLAAYPTKFLVSFDGRNAKDV